MCMSVLAQAFKFQCTEKLCLQTQIQQAPYLHGEPSWHIFPLAVMHSHMAWEDWQSMHDSKITIYSKIYPVWAQSISLFLHIFCKVAQIYHLVT